MILEINIGAGFVPVACLTDVSENETVELIGTTTRQNASWKTSRPISQNKTISITGLLPVDTALFSWEDLADLKRARTQFDWRIADDSGRGFISDLQLSGAVDSDVTFSATIQNTGQPIAGPPAGYTVRWIANPVTTNTTAFDITNGQVGATYNYEITSSGGGTPITGSGTLGNTSTRIFRNVSSLNNGTMTVSVTLTNVNGTGPTVTDDTTLNIAPPVIPVGISVSAASPTTIIEGETATWVVTYTNADTITLTAGNISLTNGFTGNISVTNGADPATQRNITVTNINGPVPGTTRPQIAAGTATNGSGGSAPSANGGSVTVNPTPPPAPSGYALAWNNDPIQSNTPGLTLTGGNGQGTGITGVVVSSGGGSPVGVSQSFGGTPFGFTVNVASLPNGTLTANLTVTGPGGSQTITPAPTTTKNT